MKFKFLLLPALTLGLFFTSCKKDSNTTPTNNNSGSTTVTDANETTNNKINGNWKVTSLTIDGIETMGKIFQQVKMEYQKQDKTNGFLDLLLIDVTGSTTVGGGNYEIRNKGTEVALSSGEFYTISFNGNKMSMTGNNNGEKWVFEATK